MEEKMCVRCGKRTVILGASGDYCYSCNVDIYNENLKQSLLDDEDCETDCETDVFCPYCGEIQESDEGQFYKEGTKIVCCGDCNKEFKLDTEISYYYSTRRL